MVDKTKVLRAKVKKCINALNSNQPIVFGNLPLIQGGRDASLYVKGLHGGDSDLICNLAARVDFDEGGGTYLFSGNRGTGKTTELMRLADLLQQQGCEVFYVDMAEYMNLISTVEITDFLISLLGGFSEKIDERFEKNPSDKSFYERIGHFLLSEVKVEGVDLNVGGSDISTTLKMSLHQDRDFKEKLQKGTRGHVARLVQEARRFVADAIVVIRKHVAEEKKIVLIVDSVEKLRGMGDSESVAEVFKSVEALFSSSSDNLRFPPLYLVCTVPPYLSAMTGSVAAYYSGGQIFMLPSVHVYEGEPRDGAVPIRSDEGLELMLTIVAKRFPEREEFFIREQLLRLAANSGGDLRDFFRMIELCIIEALYQPLPLPDRVIANAESALRNDMPLARDDKTRLKTIQEKHKGEWANLDDLPNFARLMEGKYILNYRNGDNWFDVHPLLRAAVSDSA